jgi:putative tricarboxylic transport membrane protein
MNPRTTPVYQQALTWGLALLLPALVPALTAAANLDHGRCVAPAKPGGGFDLTCQFVRDALQASGQTRRPLDIHYQPGGIGALAFRNTLAQQPPDNRTVVAFSSGSLLNLAQGRFGPHRPQDVHWLAVVGLDHGVIAVRRDSPYKSLKHLLEALQTRPNSVVFGAGGSIGSQDWMKAALLARAAGASHKNMRFVAFEGGGEALAALMGDHVQVLAADAAEVGRYLDQGKAVRVLATLSAQRLGGRWAQVPTAREQGLDIRWPIVRGLYMGPGLSERDRKDWTDALKRAMDHPLAARERAASGMEHSWISGPELNVLVQTQVDHYRQLASELGVIPP